MQATSFSVDWSRRSEGHCDVRALLPQISWATNTEYSTYRHRKGPMLLPHAQSRTALDLHVNVASRYRARSSFSNKEALLQEQRLAALDTEYFG
jgi:hypothetical protein